MEENIKMMYYKDNTIHIHLAYNPEEHIEAVWLGNADITWICEEQLEEIYRQYKKQTTLSK